MAMILKTIILASLIFNDFNATLIIAGLSVLFFLLLSRLMCWRMKAGNAFYAAAKFAPSDAIRTRYARKGVLAGNKEARLLYIFSSPASFSDRRPLSAFKIKKIPFVFSDFYFPARYRKYLSVPQEDFTRSVLAFKDGMNDSIDFFLKGIDCLKPKEGAVVMFMPCSAWWKYWVRFRHIADYIERQCPKLENGFGYYSYMGERDSLHLQRNRTDAVIERNFEIRCDLTGKDVIVVDDIITSGKSLRQLKKQIEAAGGHVSGAIFFAGTFAMPGKITTFLTALSEEITLDGTSLSNTCDMVTTHGQDMKNTSTLCDRLLTDKKEYADNTGEQCRMGQKHGNMVAEQIPDRTIVYEDSSMAFCYRHFIPGKRPYYTAVHIPAEEKEADFILRHLAEIIEADKHREPTEYELSLDNHPYCN